MLPGTLDSQPGTEPVVIHWEANYEVRLRCVFQDNKLTNVTEF